MMKKYPNFNVLKYLTIMLVSLFSTTVAVAQCVAPGSPTISDITAASATATWSASPTTGGAGYEYEFRINANPGTGGSTTRGGAVENGVLTVRRGDLTVSTTYRFYVRYRCVAGSTGNTGASAWTLATIFTTLPLSVPVATAATPIGDVSFTANWEPQEGAQGYTVQVATSPDFEADLVATKFVLGATLFDFTTDDFDIMPETTYYYRVNAYAVGGQGPQTTAFSNTITVTTNPPASTTTVWDGTKWSQNPLPELKAVINGNYDTSVGGDGLFSQTSFSCMDLTINNGFTLVIASGTYVEVAENIINNNTTLTSPGLIVQNNANLLQLNDFAEENVGLADVIRDSSPLFRLDYTMWSSPVTGTQTLEDFSSETLLHDFTITILQPTYSLLHHLTRHL